jgi:hypothetical protein
MKSKSELFNCICTVCQSQFQSTNKNSFTCHECCPSKPINKKWLKFEQHFRMKFESKFSHDMRLMNEILSMVESEIFLK